ncbi:hypothetical protein FRACYDRAFT_264007 [Fragilariopsis cylindrus CCMP1102]|uniref:Suppressor of forked domain-containing protein n=1 Tax=Fragilariopsis cylindrus CCMP1102 TaxID=635003 RepID=A0A1E7EVZ9_9STRA|nr:hypothetical protein FRACYDRAFT_264007 [Fragilariopsis cylindrus CCMP1102]|eukprot:OEU10200.1 hypothetical protein FRACYDRAFT_264007 [Fragilariopsis cylindrus CCMP1102]
MVGDPRRRTRSSIVETSTNDENAMDTTTAADTVASTDAVTADTNNSNNSNSESILFAGDDAMDEDEDLFDSDEPLQDEPLQDEPLQDEPTQQTSSADGDNASSSYFSSASLLNGGKTSNVVPHRDIDLISIVISPSPFAHHSVGGSGSSRYRNALTRIGADPRSDVEAWGALLAEASSCWKSLYTHSNNASSTTGGGDGIGGAPGGAALQVVHVNIAARNSAETQLQLDWIESCYGSFLKYFSYSCSHIRSIGEILFVQSARVGEEGGPVTDYGQETPGTMSRSQQAQWKLETILRKSLGVDLEGNNTVSMTTTTTTMENPTDHNTINTTATAASLVGGMCTPSVELWLLYIKTRIRHVKRKHSLKSKSNNTMEAAKAVLEDSKKAYELALEFSGFTCHDNNLLHMMWLREVYQKLIGHPMTGLDQLWQEYESFEKNQSEALAAALIAEWQPKYQHARNVYLERNKVFSIQDLNWKTSLAVPPISTAWVERLDAIRTGVGGAGGKKGTGVGGVGGDKKKKLDDDATISEEDLQEYHKKLRNEFDYLNLWKKRCAYERTNPERLTNPQELAHRIRQAYKEMVCVLTLYPEVWHMWSTWEDTLATSTAVPTTTPSSASSETTVADNRSIAVLQIGQGHIPDSTLLVQAHVQLVEVHALHLTNGKASNVLEVLENYLERAPTSLGFCLYQRLVRRYKGIDAARVIFAKARRVLFQGFDQSGGNLGNSSTVQTGVGGANVVATSAAKSAGTDSGMTEDSNTSGTIINGNRWMVTNRLDPSIGKGAPMGPKSMTAPEKSQDNLNTSIIKIAPGQITWHLYACHATIEHRLNKSPEIAARVYELGLRKHSSFLTKPPYVLKYAKLLLELQDTVNLRALLTRALAACGDSKNSGQVEALWDMTLQCEEMWSISEPSNIEAAIAIERKRRVALLGPDVEDVSTGSRVGLTDSRATVGSTKSSLAEQLIRVDGYNTSSLIVNGLGRTVDVLDIMGLWGDGSGGKKYLNRSNFDENDELIPGGKSDRSYQDRLQFAEKLAAGVNVTGIISGLEPGSKLSSARERLQQGGGPVFQNTPIQLAIQQNPEWLRNMLLLLPASRLRSPIVPKAPPHMVVQALTTLRQNKLPEERPKDDKSKELLSGKKRAMGDNNTGGGGDSSDEEGPSGSGGYGTQFRSRQAARMANGTNE